MSSNTPQRDRLAPRRAAATLARLILSLAVLTGASAGAAASSRGEFIPREPRADSSPRAALTPQQQTNGPAPAPTPYVRPRTVGPKAAPAAPPQPEAAAPEPKGEAQVSEAVDEDEVVRVESNLVLIPASVVDGNGRAVTNLGLEDFELKVDGEPKPISDLRRAETPVNITLLFDNSQSLSAAREFEKQAALRFFRALVRPIDRAAIYSVSTQPRLEQNFTNNVAGLVRTIENFGPPAGATALFDAIAQAADHISPLPGRKVLVLVSDGSDTLSDLNFDEALNRTLRAECQIYVVQTRQIEDPSLNDVAAEQTMRKLTEQTGGAVFIPRSVEDLDAAFGQISLDISQQYLLSYNPQDERKDNYFRFIDVSVRARPHLRVRARKGFYPFAGQPGVARPDALAAARPARPNASGAAAPAQPSSPTGAKRNTRGANSSARAASRENGSGRLGPAAPDAEESARPAQPAQELEEPATTLTLTVSENTSEPRQAPADTPPAAPSEPRPAPNTVAAAEEPQRRGASADPNPSEEERKRAAQKTQISGGVLNSKALTLPRPTYPQVARNAGVTGTVIVEVTIDERGNVADVHAVSGPPVLHQAAVAAARQAKFSPTTLSGEPVRVKGTINYTFLRP